MSFVRVLLLILLCFSSFTQADELKKNELSVLSKKADVIIKAMLDNQASEYKKARVYKLLSGKYSRKLAVVVFTIEGFNGGNNYQFYMAIFGSPSERFRLLDVIKIGEKTWRHVDFNSVVTSGDGIEINTLEYQDSDANCCPSKKGKARFVLTDRNRLIETDPSSGTK
jgi:hypothetical protein